MKIPVTFVSSDLGVGGAERQWAVLIPLLRERGFAPSVLTLLGTGAFYGELADAGIPVRFAGLEGRTDVPGMARLLARGSTSRVIVSQSFAAQCISQALARVAGVPHVTTEHQPAGLPRRRHERLLLSCLAPWIPAAVAVTPSQIPDLVEVGYRRERIRIIPNGIPPLKMRGDGAALRTSLGLDGRFVAVLVARMHDQKRPEVFVDAVRRAARREPALCGLVVGAGPEASRVEAATARSDGTVRMLGERSDAVELLAMSDVVCLSSYAEGLSMVLLEAMALGKPIVATDVGGTRDAVVPETTGLLVESGDVDGLADALVRLARDPRLGASLGRRGKKRHAERFTADTMADQYALLLESMSTTRRPPND